MRYIPFLFLLSCSTNMPNAYGQIVTVESGSYKGAKGWLIGDCDGLENYKIKLMNDRLVCVRAWNLYRGENQ